MHEALELLKLNMQLNNAAEGERSSEVRHAYVQQLAETLDQVTSDRNSLTSYLPLP